jgi:hypothetical protein
MNPRSLLLLALTLSMTACGFSVPVFKSNFDWRYPTLSKNGCPDISGVYINHEELFRVLTGGVRPHKGAVYESLRKLKGDGSENDLLSRIERQGDKITVTMTNGEGIPYSRGTFALDGEDFGCADGHLVINMMSNHLSPEAGNQSVWYGEIMLRKEANGALTMTRISTTKRRRLWGAFKPPEQTVQTWTFERVGD